MHCAFWNSFTMSKTHATYDFIKYYTIFLTYLCICVHIFMYVCESFRNIQNPTLYTLGSDWVLWLGDQDLLTLGVWKLPEPPGSSNVVCFCCYRTVHGDFPHYFVLNIFTTQPTTWNYHCIPTVACTYRVRGSGHRTRPL